MEPQGSDPPAGSGSGENSPPRKILKQAPSKPKREPKPGSKNAEESKSIMDWYNVCHAYKSQPLRMSKAAFLRSDASGPKFSGTKSECVGLGKYLKEYEAGTLKSQGDSMRRDTTKFAEVKKKLVSYLNLRACYYKRDKCGVSWSLMQEKALKFAKQLDIPEEDFKASDGWLNHTLKRNNWIGITLHREADDMNE